MQNNTIEELIQLKQDGKIGWCELALRSDHGKAYLQWCDDHGIEPDDVKDTYFYYALSAKAVPSH